jgi:two-component system, OmpR family, alkaline phosphatase synthesis response regulator PhoP
MADSSENATEDVRRAHTVLVVDDEAHILQVLKLKLRNSGYSVITAVDGEEGFEVATRELPDLIIADFHMPYMTGLEMCHALAKQSMTSRIPVVLLTARGYALDDGDVAVGNIRDILSKPFSPRAIVQYVDRLLGGESQARDSDAESKAA